MTENWIHTNEQTVLTLGDNDIAVTVPIHQLKEYAPNERKGEPIQLPTGVYRASGWCEVDGDPNRVTVRLSRDSFVTKPKGVVVEDIKWRAI